MTHVTLIRPALVSSAASYSSPVTPPIGLAYLAGTLLDTNIDVIAIDALGENPDEITREGNYLYQGLSLSKLISRIPRATSLIGISCMFTQDWPYTRRVIREIRKHFPTIPIVAGGEHVTALPQYSLEDCPELDCCVLGEGEETLKDVALYVHHGNQLNSRTGFGEIPGLAYFSNGTLVNNPPRKRIRALDEIPKPAWDIFPLENYLQNRNAHGVYLGRSMPILATRGCPYECTFCSNPTMYGRMWLARSPQLVLDEIEQYLHKYRATNIDFYDLTMVVRKDWILEFCREIEKRGLSFTWQLPSGTRSEVIDEEVAQALYETGCRNITYAPESGSKETLRAIKKMVKLPNLIRSVRASLRVGIHVKCNLIIGFPHETRRQAWKTILFAWKLALLGVHDAPLYIFSPYPGSELFEQVFATHFPQGLNEQYFRSLVAFMDLGETTTYCRHIGPRELTGLRFIGMTTFYTLSFLLRPWRFVKLIRNILHHVSETVLEQRLGALLFRPNRSPAPHAGN